MTTSNKSLPKKIGPYPIQSLLADHRYYQFYSGSDPETKRPLAIKALNHEYLTNPQAIEQFLDEAKLIEGTKHKNIVKVYSHGEWEKGYYLAMEFVQGVSLRHFIEETPMSLRHAVETILQVAHALSFMHSNGIIHCDIKPENILITTKGTVKVIDFGIAHIFSQHLPKKEGKSLLVGTPGYMSPEQEKTPNKPAPSWDIYALGVIAYELLTQQQSLGKFTYTLLPKGIRPFIEKALNPSPKERYTDLIDWITELSLYLNSPEFHSDTNQYHFDQDSESETIRKLQKKFLFPKLPSWPRLGLGLHHHDSTDLSGIYYEFLTLDEGLMAIFTAEVAHTGIEGVFLMNYLKGAIKSLVPLTKKPSQLMMALNEQIYREQEFDIPVAASLLILDPNLNQFRFSSCGYGPLWTIEAGSNTPRVIETDNFALGIDLVPNFLEVKQNWNVGDALFLHTLRAVGNKIETSDSIYKRWQKLLIDSLYLEPQKQVEKIYQKVLKGRHPSEISKTFLLLSLQRRH